MPLGSRSETSSLLGPVAKLVAGVAAVGLLAGSCGAGNTDSSSAGVPGLMPDDLARVDADPTPTQPVAEPTATATPEPEGPARVVIDLGGPPVFDPVDVDVTSPAELQILDLVYDGLTEWDRASGAWRYALATEMASGQDGLEWMIRLDPTAVFSDGSPITSADVVRSLTAVLEQDGSLPALRLDVVRSVEEVDGGVRIRLRHPDPYLPSLLASPLFGVTPAAPLDGVVGSGPYAIAADGLMSPVNADSGLPEIELGDDGPDITYAPGPGARLSATPTRLVEVHYALNVASPKLADISVRSAIVDAIAQTDLVDDLDRAAIPIDELAPLVESCSPRCDDGSVAGDGLPPIFVDYVIDDSGFEADLAEGIAAQLNDAGIVATPRGHGLEDFVALVASGGHELYRTGWVGLAAELDGMLSPYLSGSPDNVSGHRDAAFDLAVSIARRSGSEADYADAAALLDQAAVLIPVMRTGYPVGLSSQLAELEFGPDGTFDVAELAGLG